MRINLDAKNTFTIDKTDYYVMDRELLKNIVNDPTIKEVTLEVDGYFMMQLSTRVLMENLLFRKGGEGVLEI